MSMVDRLLQLGISPARIKTLGLERPANETQPRADGLNPAGVIHAANRERARALAERAVCDISSWRAYRDASDPFERAKMSRDNFGSIERGRELDEGDDDGEDPSAA
jgi:hypothetical protein